MALAESGSHRPAETAGRIDPMEKRFTVQTFQQPLFCSAKSKLHLRPSWCEADEREASARIRSMKRSVIDVQSTLAKKPKALTEQVALVVPRFVWEARNKCAIPLESDRLDHLFCLSHLSASEAGLVFHIMVAGETDQDQRLSDSPFLRL
jgi:hypothetical protein